MCINYPLDRPSVLFFITQWIDYQTAENMFSWEMFCLSVCWLNANQYAARNLLPSLNYLTQTDPYYPLQSMMSVTIILLTLFSIKAIRNINLLPRVGRWWEPPTHPINTELKTSSPCSPEPSSSLIHLLYRHGPVTCKVFSGCLKTETTSVSLRYSCVFVLVEYGIRQAVTWLLRSLFALWTQNSVMPY